MSGRCGFAASIPIPTSLSLAFPREERLNDIRPLDPADIPQVAALRRRIFQHGRVAPDLEMYYRRGFLENPWRQDEFPSLVLTDAEKTVVGFLGIIPRPFTLGAERLTCITTTEFMVAPEVRGVAGVGLMRRALDMAHDAAGSDRCNDRARSIYEAMGGASVSWFSSYWSVPLDGRRVVFDVARGTGPMRGIPARVLRRAARSFDLLDTRLGQRPFARKPEATEHAPLALDTVVSLIAKAAGPNALTPVYDVKSLAWLLDRLVERREGERLITAQVLRENAVVGWFMYLLFPSGVAEVVQLAALRGNERFVFQHLLHHATESGCVLLRGRTDRRFASSISEMGLPLTLGQPWTVVRSRRPEIAAQFHSGAAFFSRLDSEWWLPS